MSLRFGPNLPGASSSTVAFGHARHSAAAYVPVVRCFAANSAAVLQQRRRERRCFAGLGIVRIAAGATRRVLLVYWTLQRRNQPYLDAPSYPAPLTAQKRLFDDVLQQSRICFFLVLYCSREKVQFLILRSDDDRLRRTVGSVNRILNKNRHLSF
jgi:hypothetical protein